MPPSFCLNFSFFEERRMLMAACALSTIDNPFNPFDDFENWLRFDTDKGYNSCEYLARIAKTSNEFGESMYNQDIEEAIDEIVRMNTNGMYIKVVDEGT